MTDSTTEKPKGGAVADDKELGVSRGIVAAGYSFKDGLIWGLVATVAAYAVLALGRKPGNFIDGVAHKLQSGHDAVKNWSDKGVKWVAKLFKIEIKDAPGSAITATALIAGAAVGHIVQAPAAVKGWHKADQAIKKYDDLRQANTDLKESNTLLAEDVARLNKALAEVKRPDPKPEQEAVASR